MPSCGIGGGRGLCFTALTKEALLWDISKIRRGTEQEDEIG